MVAILFEIENNVKWTFLFTAFATLYLHFVCSRRWGKVMCYCITFLLCESCTFMLLIRFWASYPYSDDFGDNFFAGLWIFVVILYMMINSFNHLTLIYHTIQGVRYFINVHSQQYSQHWNESFQIKTQQTEENQMDQICVLRIINIVITVILMIALGFLSILIETKYALDILVCDLILFLSGK